LYKISKGRGGDEYAYNDEEKIKIISRKIGIDEIEISSSKGVIDQALASGKISIQRFKGLGMSLDRNNMVACFIVFKLSHHYFFSPKVK
jgi:DNA gyrase/topoisomerase IV subunit B